MAERRKVKIAVLLNFRKGWMGGIIYIVNLVNSLNALAEEDKPQIVLLYTEDLAQYVEDIKYPYLKAVQWNFPGFLKGYFQSFLLRENIFVHKIIEDYKPDGIYPINDWPLSGKKYLERGVRMVAWIPDLQHKIYPRFFSKSRVFFRDQRIKMLLRNASDLAVSSYDTAHHFRKFYKIKPSLRIHPLRFVSSISKPDVSWQLVSEKYHIPDNYFIISNQFTNHKNHLLVFKALALLRAKQHRVHVVFTGKMDFKGNEEYIAAIRKFIADEELDDQVSLLGIIPRNDQLVLMTHAQAIIQPSLFEGWSTVIEDAKTLGVPVIASDLPVNIEQLGSTGTFFNRFDEKDLADKIESFQKRPVEYQPYEQRVVDFARSFIKIFSPAAK